MAQKFSLFYGHVLILVLLWAVIETIAFNNTTISQEVITKKVLNVTTINNGNVTNNTHRGREGLTVTDVPKIINKTINLKETSEKIKQKQLIYSSPKPFIAKPVATANNVNKQPNTTKTASKQTSAPKLMKPKVTEHDEVVLPKTQKSNVNPSMVNFELNTDKKVRRADYIVPIVAVILSVPLVAIIISVLYKRGKDWWQHRNYRRMDYLIEGMYNS